MVDSKGLKSKTIEADKTLQYKVGTGSLDEQVVERCQAVIDDNDFDFLPLANEYLDLLNKAIQETKSGNFEVEAAVETMTAAVMQLKAHAALFKYELIGTLSNVMLSFLESITALDEDAVAIVGAHYKTLSVIVSKEMQGDGGVAGAQMEEELQNACKRYFAR